MRIEIIHPSFGRIDIHSEIPQEVNDIIGTIISDYSKYKFYYGDIVKNDNETITISNFGVVGNENFLVGYMRTSGGSKNFISLITNRKISDEIIVYPNNICCIH